MVPFYKIAKPRANIDKNIEKFGAQLADVKTKTGNKNYYDLDKFNSLTYETEGMKQALEDVRKRLQDGAGSGFRQIVTNFGGGKTHVMISMFHKCRDWGAIPIVIDGMDLGKNDTVWGEISKQIPSANIINDKISPDMDEILKMFDCGKPVLVLIDEIMHYLPIMSAVTVGNSDMAIQTVSFLQKLLTAAERMPNVCIIISLPDISQVVDKTHYETLEDMAGKKKQLITVSTDKDIPHIVRKQLFETSQDVINDKSKLIIERYTNQCIKSHMFSKEEKKEYMDRFRDSFPFTPEVIDILVTKWGSLPKFQKTRGVLRILSQTLKKTTYNKNSEYIALGDIDLTVDSIRAELIDYTGSTDIKSVIIADIIADKRTETEKRICQAVFMHSFPQRDDKCATKSDIQLACMTSILDQYKIESILTDLYDNKLIYLHQNKDKTYKFTSFESINGVLARTYDIVEQHEIEKLEFEELNKSLGVKFSSVAVWPDKSRIKIDDLESLQLLLLKNNDVKFCNQTLSIVSSKQGRINQNSIIFVMPSKSIKFEESARKFIATDIILETRENLTQSEKEIINKQRSNAYDGIIRNIRSKYNIVFLPDKSGIKEIRTRKETPNDDNVPVGDLIYNKLIEERQILESIGKPILKSYMKPGESCKDAVDTRIFEQMRRTRGEKRPVNKQVLLDACNEPPIIEKLVILNDKAYEPRLEKSDNIYSNNGKFLVNAGAKLELHVEAVDIDGDDLSYQWLSDSVNILNSNRPDITVKIPKNLKAGNIVSLKCNVSDGKATAVCDVILHIDCTCKTCGQKCDDCVCDQCPLCGKDNDICACESCSCCNSRPCDCEKCIICDKTPCECVCITEMSFDSIMSNNELGSWGGIYNTLLSIDTTNVKLVVEQVGVAKYKVRLNVKGTITRKIFNEIKNTMGKNVSYEEVVDDE